MDNQEERGGYTGAQNAYEAITQCLKGIRKNLREEGRVVFEYFKVSDVQMYTH